MERQVGEIFKYNGEWYQCMEGTGCYRCAFYDKNICIADNPHCTCRSDKKNVIFKKLEKVGEPYEYFIRGMGIIIVQEYILANASYIYDDNRHVVMMDCQNGRIAIEIKQNKEDMEEKKLNLKPFDLEAAKAGKPVCTRDGRKARIISFDRHGEDCPAPMPKEIHPLLKSMHGEEHRANITNILPTEIRGQFIINDEIIKKE